MRHQLAWLLSILCVVTLLTGCWDDRPVEERGMVLMLGVAPAAHRGLTLYFEVPTASGLTGLTKGGSSGSSSSPPFVVYRGQGSNFTDAYTNAQGQTNEDLYLGQVQVIALSTRLSSGQFALTDATFARLGPLDKSADAVAVSGSMAKFMDFAPTGTSLPGLYLSSLFSCHHCQTAHLARTVWSREKRLWSPTSSVWVPEISIAGSTFEVDRMVVYHGYRPAMVLTPRQTWDAGLLMGITAKAPLSVPIPGATIGVRAVHASPRFKTQSMPDGKILIHVTLRVIGTLDSVPANMVITTPLLHQIEDKGAILVSHRLLAILVALQKKGANPIGFGRRYAWFHQDFASWPSLYRHAEMSVTVHIHIHQLGDMQ